MHLDQSALGILRKVEDKNGRKYMDWQIPYMNQPGLIMVYKSDSQYEKYLVYFFTSPASNKPEVVARAAKEVIADYLHAFRTIEFAVYCSPRDDTNFKVFKRVLGA